MRVAISGASGFVGSALREKFADFVIIERSDTHEIMVQKLAGVEAVFNLAGAPIIKRWSEEYKKVLRLSRIEGTKKLVAAINESLSVKHFISTSAVGLYANNVACDESGEQGGDFLANLALEWEAEALKCNKKTAILRFGVVLGKGGGALEAMLPPFRLGLGGVIGDGSMMMSWIDLKDLVRIYEHLLTNELEGIFNATAPQPVTNREFTKTLGSLLHRPTLFPVPLFVLRLLFSEGSVVLSDSKEVYPKRLLESGFVFAYPTITASLEHIL